VAAGAPSGGAPGANVPSAQAQPVSSPAPPGGAPAAAPASTTPGQYSRVEEDPLWQQGNQLVQYGAMFDDKGAMETGQEKMREAQTRWEKGAGAEQQTLAQESAKDFAEELKGVDKSTEGRMEAIQRIERNMDLMKQFPTGYWSKPGAEAIAAIKGAGLGNFLPAKFKNYAEAVQEFNKNNFNTVMDNVKGMPGTPRVAEINAFIQANAEPGKTPGANAAILTQAAGILDWQNQYAQDLAAARASGRLTPSNLIMWKQGWAAQHPVKPFVDARLKSFGYQGQMIPTGDKEKVDGQVYMNNQGQQAIWHADRNAFELMPEG
jgi:hypothetical protein